ncbi:hypothetical protein D3C73_1157410 [compost metagenome]
MAFNVGYSSNLASLLVTDLLIVSVFRTLFSLFRTSTSVNSSISSFSSLELLEEGMFEAIVFILPVAAASRNVPARSLATSSLNVASIVLSVAVS